MNVLLLSGCLHTAVWEVRQVVKGTKWWSVSEQEWNFNTFLSPPPPLQNLDCLFAQSAEDTPAQLHSDVYRSTHLCNHAGVFAHTRVQTHNRAAVFSIGDCQHLCACIIWVLICRSRKRCTKTWRLFGLNCPKVWMWWTAGVGTSQQDQQMMNQVYYLYWWNLTNEIEQ